MKKHYYESPFPSPLERTVASALLLLLSTTPPHLSPPIVMRKNEEKCERSEMMSSLQWKDSSSVISTVTSSDEICSSSKLRIPPISTITPLAARRSQIKLQVVRKSRSKKFRISDCRKASSEKSGAVSWGSESSEISTASNISSISSARSFSSGAGRRKMGGEKQKQVVWSAHLSRRADAIKGVLSSGGISEVRIRELLGDSPDTSKALRMLLKRAEVKRSGAGGRTDPYIYKIA